MVKGISFTIRIVNRRRRKKLQQRLTEAAGWTGVERVVGLLHDGADPNTPGPGRTTPLYRASVQNRVDNVRVLLATGADPNLREDNGSGRMAAEWAEAGGHQHALELLTANHTTTPRPTSRTGE
jgi:uncharacterized protein